MTEAAQWCLGVLMVASVAWAIYLVVRYPACLPWVYRREMERCVAARNELAGLQQLMAETTDLLERSMNSGGEVEDSGDLSNKTVPLGQAPGSNSDDSSPSVVWLQVGWLCGGASGVRVFESFEHPCKIGGREPVYMKVAQV